MSESELPTVAEIDAESVRLGLATSPYELHGALCGWLAGGGRDERGWLAPVFADRDLAAPAEGIVGAFGLAAGQASTLSDESREALADLAKLAAAQPQEDGDEEDEEALVEIEEFVRVAALLLHGDCVLAREHRQRLN